MDQNLNLRPYCKPQSIYDCIMPHYFFRKRENNLCRSFANCRETMNWHSGDQASYAFRKNGASVHNSHSIIKLLSAKTVNTIIKKQHIKFPSRNSFLRSYVCAWRDVRLALFKAIGKIALSSFVDVGVLNPSLISL